MLDDEKNSSDTDTSQTENGGSNATDEKPQSYGTTPLKRSQNQSTVVRKDSDNKSND